MSGSQKVSSYTKAQVRGRNGRYDDIGATGVSIQKHGFGVSGAENGSVVKATVVTEFGERSLAINPLYVSG